MSAPIPIRVTRHQCPHCRRTWAHKAGAIAHMRRCLKNPAAHGCKTCALWQEAEAGDGIPYGYPGCRESCGAGIDLGGGLKTGCPKWEAIW